MLRDNECHWRTTESLQQISQWFTQAKKSKFYVSCTLHINLIDGDQTEVFKILKDYNNICNDTFFIRSQSDLKRCSLKKQKELLY